MWKKLIGVLFLAAACVSLQGAIRAKLMQQDLAGRILRFHVLADSDGAEDQRLKLQVRDAVGALMAEKLADADSLGESREVVKDSLREIERTARGVLRRQGCDDPVTAALETCAFPEKTYGRYTFPAGDYEALRVVVGSGAGHNWWCVMYPNLCFAGSVCAVDGQSGEVLQKALTAEEYEAVLEEKNYKVRFKILGFMNKLLE